MQVQRYSKSNRDFSKWRRSTFIKSRSNACILTSSAWLWINISLKVKNSFFFTFFLQLQKVDRWSLWACHRSSCAFTYHHWNNTIAFSCPAIPDTIWNDCPSAVSVTSPWSGPISALCTANGRSHAWHVQLTWVSN